MPIKTARPLTSAFLVAVILLSFIPGYAAPVRARSGMVASQHEIASAIGVEVLKRGGNAVDAAVAVSLALAVVYPEAGNIGGGGFMLIRKPNGVARFIDYREMAPRSATRDVFLSNGTEIKGEGSSTVGYRAAGVPGTMAGLDLAFKKYGSGRIRWADVVRPARIVAQRGFVLTKRNSDLFRTEGSKLALYGDSKRIFLNGGRLFEEGEVLKQPELASTLGRIERLGAREFYTGATARMIAADMRANNGLITLEDLRGYAAKEREPITGTYRGFPIISAPPPSSGGLVMFEILNILEGFNMKGAGYNSAQRYHLIVEAMKRAFADRAEYMGDPDFSNVPAAKLSSKQYAEERRRSIHLQKATPSRAVIAGLSTEPSETTHFTVVDKDGMIVSNTTTLNDYWGSKVTARGTGVLLNNEMDDFATRPGFPNMYGLVQGEANAVGPGKRPLSAMTPTIVLNRDGTPWFALGARGGPRIISAVTQVVMNVVDHGLTLQEAVDAPRVHHQWLPDELRYERLGFSPDTVSVLASFGHKFTEKPENVASVTAIMIAEDGYRIGVIDPRSDGTARGY